MGGGWRGEDRKERFEEQTVCEQRLPLGTGSQEVYNNVCAHFSKFSKHLQRTCITYIIKRRVFVF